ncbi:sodium- and chloride-dependent GABA transporter 1-like isoform X1 [Gigantopelta aegis]|uniref:sodium- and chloride-dependent GABA transporter 1-like isoform X1 n=1 Tax=Gigantopelta aegis TaxID=1735272 RepID=UPI001B88C418|nr:sodium- and chloride-dependent GABA transporter 1-like isoform X1 [Gigantopelta aegis]
MSTSTSDTEMVALGNLLTEEKKPKIRKQDQWPRKSECLLSLIGYSVGLGNIWRFPYICQRNGGGAFLIPYCIFIIALCYPIFFLEQAIGQYSGLSPTDIWSMCPMLKGIGHSMVTISVIGVIIYSILGSWSMFYLYNSFSTTLAWTTCDNWWNSIHCITGNESNNISAVGNVTVSVIGLEVVYNTSSQQPADVGREYDMWGSSNTTRTSLEEYFLFNTLRISSGFGDVGKLQMHLAIGLLLYWFLIYLCVMKGIKSVGKAVYVTAVLPYVLLTVLLVRSAILPGGVDGILYYLTPDFTRLGHTQVWLEALMQVFFSLGTGWGGIITFSSHNKFKNNFLWDSWICTLVGEGTSIYAGLAVFSVLGFLAKRAGKHIADVAAAGPGLAFIVYPQAISLLPLPQLWAVIFFLMLITVGLDSQFGCVETFMHALLDGFPRLRKHRMLVTAATTGMLFALSLVLVSQGGVYIFQLIDWYFCTFSLLFISSLECLAIGWCYGARRFGDDIKMMLGWRPPAVYNIFCFVIAPTMLMTALVVSFFLYKPPNYGEYEYPRYARIIGWMFAGLTVLPIPAYLVREFLAREGRICTRLIQMLEPDTKWGPRHDTELMTYSKTSLFKRRTLRENARDILNIRD